MNLEVFKYRNTFPSDMTEAGGFLLKIMGLLPPVHELPARMILKPLVCDDLALATLRSLESLGYIWHRETQQGVFYALTAKATAYLDIRKEKSKHRAQEIKDKPLLTNLLKAYTAGSALVSAGAAVYTEAWNILPQDEKTAYLNKRNVTQAAFEARLAALDTTTIDLLPRSLVTTSEVIKRMTKAILTGQIPFTAPYNKAIYTNATDSILKCSYIYDVGQAHVSRLSSKLKSSTGHGPDEQLLKDLDVARKQTEEARQIAEVLTYSHGSKVLSLSALEANGVFVERMDDETITFGVLNNAPHGLYFDTLTARLDFCVSLSDHLFRACFFRFYTLAEDRAITERRLSRVIDTLPFACPPILWTEIAGKRPPQKWEAWKALL